MKLSFWRHLPHDHGSAECIHEVECESFREEPYGVQLFRVVEQPTPQWIAQPGTIMTLASFKPRRRPWWDFLLGMGYRDHLEEDYRAASAQMGLFENIPRREHFMTIRASSFHYFQVEHPVAGDREPKTAAGQATS